MDKIQLSKNNNAAFNSAYDDAQTEAGNQYSNQQTLLVDHQSDKPKGILKNADSIKNNNRISSQIQSIFNQIQNGGGPMPANVDYNMLKRIVMSD